MKTNLLWRAGLRENGGSMWAELRRQGADPKGPKAAEYPAQMQQGR
jgi:hypothetical protein